MSNNCQHTNSLQRSGTSRQQRLLDALLPDYVAVDERKIDDLKAFIKNYAREIRFYKYNTDIESLPSWERFFEKEIDPQRRTDPHYALFMAFLQLFKIAQDDLNQITQKHLDFYYRDVLELKEKKAKADQAFIIFELAKHVHQHLIPKGTRLKAGKDDEGKELIYITDRDIVLNKAVISELKAIYKDGDGRIFSSPIANSADGEGAEIETAEMNWRTFGKPTFKWPDNDRTQAEIGFAIASPLLFLAEGDREITLKIYLKENSANTLSDTLQKLSLRDVFRVRFSGEEDWIEARTEDIPSESTAVSPSVTNRILDFLNTAQTWQDIAGIEPQAGPVFDDPDHGYSKKRGGYDIGRATAKKILAKRQSLGPAGFTGLNDVRNVEGVGSDKINDLIYSFKDPGNTTIIDASNQTITIRRTITKAQDPIVQYLRNEKTLTDPFETEWPVMKCTLRTDADPYPMEILQQLNIEKIDLSVHVSEVRELIVQNDQTLMDPGKNFQPFGMRPLLRSNFYVGSAEVFSKNLDMLTLHLKWHGLPELENGFGDYYKHYIGEARLNNSFKAGIYVLDKKNWVKVSGTDPALLFSDESGKLLPDHVITIENSDSLSGISRDASLGGIDEFDTDSKKGFLKLELSGRDFGHKDYTTSYTKAVMDSFNGVDDSDPVTPDDTATTEEQSNLPNEPYTPTIKELSLDYRSSAEINVLNMADEPVEQYMHVGAFGVSEPVADSKNKSLSLLPRYKNEGTLYIGIDNFSAGQTLSVLFQIAEGSADPDLEPQDIHWSYLANNVWIEFEEFDILTDSSSGLLTSGIIQFSVPKAASNNNTLLPAGKHWLRATVNKKSDAVSDLIQVTTQAVPATFKDMGNDPGHLEEPLPAETITKLKEADSAISSVQQPFSSFGGAVKEEKDAFYTRVSERLRHKNRAVTIWDYERLVLESFPSVYKVKCLNHTRFNGSLADYSELAPGHVTLVVISNVRNKNAVDPLRPKTSLITLTEINDYLAGLNSDCVELHVKNPVYEEIEISLNVKFHTGFDNGFYAKQLENDLKSFLSPWAYETSSDLELGGKIHKSVVLNYVEERNYVDFLTCFEMRHIIVDPASGDVVSRTRVDEAEAGTSVSILGSVGQAGRYGDHIINVLETDDCECDTNEIKSTATIASADDCGCP